MYNKLKKKNTMQKNCKTGLNCCNCRKVFYLKINKMFPFWLPVHREKAKASNPTFKAYPGAGKEVTKKKPVYQGEKCRKQAENGKWG